MESIKINSYYEGLIQNLYGNSKGCFSCFMHFFYQYNQSLIFSQENSECFAKLHQLELQNCELLSGLIIRMGGDNKFYSSSRKFVSGYNVDYVKNFSKIFLVDIELLENGIIELKSVVLKIEDKVAKEVVKKVLENKKIELKILKENYFKNNLISKN